MGCNDITRMALSHGPCGRIFLNPQPLLFAARKFSSQCISLMSDFAVCIYKEQENIPPGLLTFVANRATCGACGVHTPRQRCSKCKAAWYCSRKCQRGAWPVHRLSCEPPATTNAVWDKVQQVREFMSKRHLRRGMYATVFSHDGSDFVLYEPACPNKLRATIEGGLLDGTSSSSTFSKAYRGHIGG